MTPEQIQEIARLRTLNLSPKQIARQLGLRPAEVTAQIRAQATELETARVLSGELDPIDRCLINDHAAQVLLNPQANPSQKELEQDGIGGLAEIFVIRSHRNDYLISIYLVDYWCLGVKDAVPPRKANRNKCEQLIEQTYANFGQGCQSITLEQAQAIIFGAVDYAASLGIQPHPDFEQAKAHLGQRMDNLPAIEFGHNGKPFYISGPYDKPEKIIATLKQSVGEGNFEYLIQTGSGMRR